MEKTSNNTEDSTKVGTLESDNSKELSTSLNKKEEEVEEINEKNSVAKFQSKQSFFDLKIIPLSKLKLDAPFPSSLSYSQLKRKPLTFLEGYKLTQHGIICVDQEIVNSQSGIFKEIAKQLAKNIFKGGSVISLSLPIRVFEEKSMLEKYCDWWVHAPFLLKEAGKIKDPLESLKYVICFGLSSLHFSASQLKPFNPLLGETYQGEFEDGTKVYLEHTSHHPCVSNFYIKDIDNLFSISGYFDMQPEGTIKMLLTNYVYLLHKGRSSVYLKASNRVIDYQIPKLHFGGIVYGERMTFWEGFMKFEDRSANLKAVIQFKPKNGKFHDIYGEIYKYDFSKEKKKEFYESTVKDPFPKDRSLVLAVITGSYLESILIDNKEFLNVKEMKLTNLLHEKKFVLPGDFRYREDINWLTRAANVKYRSSDLKKEFENFAQDWKLALEAQQRHDRKLREKKK